MFITFEGIDGCGKTTQIKLLEQFYLDKGKEVIPIREPGGTPFSENIRKILLHSKEDISPVSELLLFNAARANLVEQVIKPALNEGKIIICDRFFDSTTAYQGYGRGLDLNDVINSNMMATAGLKPDLTFYLDIPLEISHERTNRNELDRMERSGDVFFNKVIKGFRELALNEPDRIKQIDGSGNIEDTYNQILKLIE